MITISQAQLLYQLLNYNLNFMKKLFFSKNAEIIKFKSNVVLVHIFTKLFILQRCMFLYLAKNVIFAS